VVDDDDLGWTFYGFHLQPELLFDCGKERWRGVGIG
jgi:hypothetical protein